MLTKGRNLNSIKINQNTFTQMQNSFAHSMKNEPSKVNQDDFQYEYNKYNSPYLEFDKQKAKEIENSFGKIIKRYEEKSKISQEDIKKIDDEKINNFKPEYKYSSCDYIPRAYFNNKNNNDKFDK